MKISLSAEKRESALSDHKIICILWSVSPLRMHFCILEASSLTPRHSQSTNSTNVDKIWSSPSDVWPLSQQLCMQQLTYPYAVHYLLFCLGQDKLNSFFWMHLLGVVAASQMHHPWTNSTWMNCILALGGWIHTEWLIALINTLTFLHPWHLRCKTIFQRFIFVKFESCGSSWIMNHFVKCATLFPWLFFTELVTVTH